ncbi:hypothetical protein BKA58DRAFT_472346 [Alternaria rosae]|uniref:uncharacterized protein n=1 Tax=Alternaria rosae TaxID=1187941 RepID=UPI001E8EC938|nr:uncharacterized protein BKA58DRAFT_472346 [Alternaria rosae]KAH6865208.1 hypothetical protein BKA58DRAFT_472346 [Alternaria rosae]
MSDKETYGSSRLESIDSGDVPSSVNAVPYVRLSIPTAGAEPSPTELRTPQSEYAYGEDGVREYQVDDMRSQAVRKHGEDSSGRQNSEYGRRQIRSSFIPPPPPPPPPPQLLSHPSSTGFHIPPPPPATTGGVAGLQPDATWNVHAEKLDREQEELRDCRDELLGSRFKLAEMRKELKDLHVETSTKEGVAFNLLRQHLNKSATFSPQEILKAFNEASTLRDRLGLLEAKYDAAEANYNTLEWNYSNKEAKFVEGALTNKLVPIGTVSRSRSADDLNIAQLTHGMTDRTEKSRDAWNHTMYCEISDPGGDTLVQTEIAQQGEALGKEEFMSSGEALYVDAHAAVSPIERGIENAQKKQERKRWLRKMARIDDWLLETVDDSRLHQLYLKAIHDVGYPDDDAWWKHTSHLLIESREELPPFRTGDSTVSNQTTSKPNISRTVDAPSQGTPTLAITSSTSPASENHPKAQPAAPSADLLHAGRRDFATLKPPTRSVSGSPVSCATSGIPSRRTSCTNTADTADTQSDATSQDSHTGGVLLDCLTHPENMDDARDHQNRSHVAESTRTTPTRQRQYFSTTSTSELSQLPDNAHALQPGLEQDSTALASRLESLRTPQNLPSSQEDYPQASEEEPSCSNSQTFQREPPYARTLEQSPTSQLITHTQQDNSGRFVI